MTTAAARPAWLRALFRMPLPLHELGLEPGAIGLGPRWARLATRGRRTGRAHVVLVDAIHREGERYFVQAADGERADWVRNVRANGELRVTIGGETFPARMEPATRPDAERALGAYVTAHPVYARVVAGFLGARTISAEGIVAHAVEAFPTFVLTPR